MPFSVPCTDHKHGQCEKTGRKFGKVSLGLLWMGLELITIAIGLPLRHDCLSYAKHCGGGAVGRLGFSQHCKLLAGRSQEQSGLKRMSCGGFTQVGEGGMMPTSTYASIPPVVKGFNV